MVDEREKVIIVRFDQVLCYDEAQVRSKPVSMKRYFDSRILTLDEPQPFLTGKEIRVVDLFKWRI
jgi:hypothetical protein